MLWPAFWIRGNGSREASPPRLFQALDGYLVGWTRLAQVTLQYEYGDDRYQKEKAEAASSPRRSQERRDAVGCKFKLGGGKREEKV